MPHAPSNLSKKEIIKIISEIENEENIKLNKTIKEEANTKE